MAAATPLENAEKFLREFNAILVTQGQIDPFTERARRNELLASKTRLTELALAYLDVVSGKLETGLGYFRLALEVNDVTLAYNYHHVLFSSFCYEELRNVIYQLTDKYPSKSLSYNAYCWAYRYGEREHFVHYMDEHIKLLSEEEGRSKAMKHKVELLTEMNDIYESSQCSEENFKILGSIIWSLLGEYKAATGFVSLNGRGSGCYVIDIKNLDSKTIAKMNFELADRVCADERLDDCAIVARFSSPRQLHTGVSYSVGV